jgi:signal transduction histidine kinase
MATKLNSRQLDPHYDTVIELDENVTGLLNYIRNSVNRKTLRIEFIRDISKKFIDHLDIDYLELWLKENSGYSQFEIAKQSRHTFSYNNVPVILDDDGSIKRFQEEPTILSCIRKYVINKTYDSAHSCFTDYGSFWINETKASLKHLLNADDTQELTDFFVSTKSNSMALIPLTVGEKIIGIIQLINEQPDTLNKKKIYLLEYISKVLGSALSTQRTQAALIERVKELQCVYKIARVVEQPGITHAQVLQHIVELLPPAWQYPEITVGRIVMDGQVYATSNFKKGWQKQKADIVVEGETRGFVEVSSTGSKPDLDEGPFLREERSLINAIAQQVVLIIKKEDIEKENLAVQEQLRHADRLATIGQLAAGVAHELNEPIGNILGFAQLAAKDGDLPAQLSHDIKKIINASLYSREVIKKLLFFAREMPPSIKMINLNDIVEEGLFFLEARCVRAGIELHRELSPDIPEIKGDPSQLTQVLTNLVVNSMQAMSKGGRLTIKTFSEKNYVLLSVIDEGTGMSQEVKEKIFLPFFSTKDINEGTWNYFIAQWIDSRR